MKIPSKKNFPNNNFINSISKSNISTSHFSPINPGKNTKTIESYEDFNLNKNFALSSPQNKSFVSNYIKNTYNFVNNSNEFKSESNQKKYMNLKRRDNGIIYVKKNCKKINLINDYNDGVIKMKNIILLNNYRKNIMKVFLKKFKCYVLIFLRKHFLSFIRNITYLIMKKELYYKNSTKTTSKKIKIDTFNNIHLSKSYENFQLINQYNVNACKNKELFRNINLSPVNNFYKVGNNYRYDSINRDFSEDNPYIKSSTKSNTTINTKGKVYEFKNVFISSNINKKKNKYGNMTVNRNKFRCFSKTIKDIITKDKRIYIRINYIFQIQKKQRRSQNAWHGKIKKINELLEETQIYSFEYISEKIKNISFINDESNNKEKAKYICEIINDIFILKQKQILLRNLKAINMIKCIEKFIKIIFFNKIGLSMKEKTISNENFLLDDKIDINTDNFKNLDFGEDL